MSDQDERDLGRELGTLRRRARPAAALGVGILASFLGLLSGLSWMSGRSWTAAGWALACLTLLAIAVTTARAADAFVIHERGLVRLATPLWPFAARVRWEAVRDAQMLGVTSRDRAGMLATSGERILRLVAGMRGLYLPLGDDPSLDREIVERVFSQGIEPARARL